MEGFKSRGERTYNLINQRIQGISQGIRHRIRPPYIKNKDPYDDREYITPEKFITADLNKYEVMLTSVK